MNLVYRCVAFIGLSGAVTALCGCTAKIVGERNEATPVTQTNGLPTNEPPAPPVASCAAGAAGPGVAYLRRLSNWEYDNTVHALLGAAPNTSVRFAFVPDAQVSGFDNNAEVVSISMPVFDKLTQAAEALSSEFAGDSARLAALVGCDVSAPACVEGFAKAFAARAFRRQLAADELESLRSLAAAAPNGKDGVARVVQAVLLSSSFLFRPEIGRPDPENGGFVQLTGEEIATRLSYLLWGSTPSDELLASARAANLDSAAGVEAAARTMLSDSRAHDGVAHFYRQWLRADVSKTLLRDPQLFPDWSPALAADMAEETARLADHFVWNPGANLLDLFNARFSFLNARLALFYGLPAPATDWQRVDLPVDSGRGGFLSTAGYLAVTSKLERPSPILRGKFVREVLMCTRVPPPPANAPVLGAAIPGESERARLERHATDAACSGCHQLTDPIGFGLSGFDAIGKRRSIDELGQPVDEHGRINGDDARDFVGAIQLGDALRTRPEIGDCFVTQLLRYGLGRGETDSQNDSCTRQELGQVFAASGYKVPELLSAFVRSDTFRKRLAEPVGAP